MMIYTSLKCQYILFYNKEDSTGATRSVPKKRLITPTINESKKRPKEGSISGGEVSWYMLLERGCHS